MILAALTLLALQSPGDTFPIYDSPATAELVERAISASGQIPPDLSDYTAVVNSAMYITLATDSSSGGDLPASVDELRSIVRWDSRGDLHQTVQGHRTRILMPVPYTLATIMERPWVIPHLYGPSIFTPFIGRPAVNPFGRRGPDLYRYAADDPVRLRVQGELVTLIPVAVRPRVSAGDVPDDRLVVGTFYLDADRGSVARARFGFVGGGSDLPETVGAVETFMELENGLWEGRYWLPFQQRREIVFSSRLLGGAVAARVVNRFESYDINTGWVGEGPRIQLAWEDDEFTGWEDPVGADAAEFSMSDFADLRIATATAEPTSAAVRVQPHYERGSDLFRYNRVEGLYLGLGARAIPANPARARWSLYGTAGWAFAEATARGELAGRWGASVARAPEPRVDLGAEVAAYRRLLDIRSFRPTYDWEWIYTLPAALWGSDERDYYDAAGVEAFATAFAGPWSGRVGARVEQHDSVSLNTTRFLFGEAEEFPPLARAEPGTHAALEGSLGYAFGPGAFGVGSSAIARVSAEAGLADFDFVRVIGMLSARRELGPLTVAGRVDAGTVQGGAPPQRLFRFGGLEGLRGYEPGEFGGSTAVLARSRVLVGLPPRSSEPLARFDVFLIPPLRPALVLVGETGRSTVDPDLQDELDRLGSRVTGGWRSAVGAGLSIFDDAFTVERLVPVGAGSDERDPRWYVGLTYWY